MDTREPPRARRAIVHDVRGRMNVVSLCAAAFDLDLTPDEELEWLAALATATTRVSAALDELDAWEPPIATVPQWPAERMHVLLREYRPPEL
jgi:hypothetical protein